jgi:hypothetical protein
MRRRQYLVGLGAGVAAALAGCSSSDLDGNTSDDTGGQFGSGGPGTDSGSNGRSEPALVENRPDAVYVPTHFEGMQMAGMGERAGQMLAVSYTVPHRFWTLQPDPDSPTTEVSLEPDDTVHLMISTWYPGGTYVPDATPSVEITTGGEVVDTNNPWQMLSQPMGFHFGDNIALDGAGTYTVSVETATPSIRRTGDLSGVGGAGSFEFELEFSQERLDSLMVNQFPDRQGTEGAVGPMQMDMPLSVLPEPGSMPGRTVGTASSGDATLVIQELDDAARFGGRESESYLAVSLRTPHNGFVLPAASLDATVTRGGETLSEGPLTETLDSGLDFHYGTTVSPLQAGDEVTVEFASPPQLARHEGYETAFIEMPPATVTV